MVIYILCETYSKSEKALFKWDASLQVANSSSVLCAMASTVSEISTGSICWLSHVVMQIDTSDFYSSYTIGRVIPIYEELEMSFNQPLLNKDGVLMCYKYLNGGRSIFRTW